jgi:N-acetylglucosaminyldiphosphoundecaprenol N-acetyl-beta-D-mannosaminyltransferase
MTVTPIRSDTAATPARDAAQGRLAPLARDDFDRDLWCILGLPIDMVNVHEASDLVWTAAGDRRRLSIVTPNVNWLVRALRNETARREILNADLSLADGAPIAACARLLGAPLKRRAAGADLFDALREKPAVAGRKLRVFFFGGRDGAAEAAAAALDADNGALEAAGALNPGHGDVESMSGAGVVDAINAAAADFVAVALGAAKGQAWIERNKDRLWAPVIGHFGAVVDFVAGTKARAPIWLRRLGLEWAWRICEEPALLRRYWTDGVALASIVGTRLLPQVLVRALRTMRVKPGAAVNHAAGKVTILLSGDLGGGSLAAIRGAFREAAAAKGDVTLDFSAAGRVDGAFLGLVLMLEKQVRARGGAIATAGLSWSQRALFKANAMNYPAASAFNALGEAAPRSAPAA